MRRIKRGFLWGFVGAALAAASPAADAADVVLDKQTGAVKYSCVRPNKKSALICVVVYTKAPYLGFQFGSEDDAESLAVTAGARRVTNSKLEIKVDKFASHAVFGEGFVGTEAEAIRFEVENGSKATVSFESQDTRIATHGDIDLKDFKAALREVESLRDKDGDK